MKRILLFTLFLLSLSHLMAQTVPELSPEEKAKREKNIQAGNPFKRFGYTPKIATLSKGKYLEFHDLDSVVRIGSFSYHVKNREIVGYTAYDTIYPESTLRPELMSRWISPDPLSEEFPSWSPYVYTNNNPIRFIDPTGMATEDWIKDRYGSYLWDNNAKDKSTTRKGWEYVGKELPNGVHPYKILTEENGKLYHKNTSNLFSSVGNTVNSWFGGDNNYFVEHKPYDPVGEQALSEAISTSTAIVGTNLVFNGLSKTAGVVTSTTVEVSSKPTLTTVGRWMSQTEYNLMRETGKIVQGSGGQTFVTTGGSEMFAGAAKGSIYVEFQVPTNSLLQGGSSNWFKIVGPDASNAMKASLQKQGGQILPEIQNLSTILKTK